MYQKISPITKCYHPKTIYKNGKRFQVACGKCSACLLRKSNTATTACKLFSKQFKYCHFVTLTYSPEYLPIMEVKTVEHNNDLPNLYHLIDCRKREKTFGDLVTTDIPDIELIPKIIEKTNLGLDKVGVLSRKDLINFIKRLRINIKRKTNYDETDFKYFAVGEYGPKTFRPHYHLLLWHNSYWSTSDISKTIRESWKYGRIDCQLSRGFSAEYCVSYSNSYSCLPRFYQLPKIAPFSLHSKGLFISKEILELRKKIYQERFTDELRFNYQKDGRSESALYPLQIVAKLLPRLPFHASIPFRTKCRVYSVLSELHKELVDKSLFQVSGEIASYFYSSYLRDGLDVIPAYDRVLTILFDLPSFTDNYFKWLRGDLDETMEGLHECISLVNAIYNILRISKMAMSICQECNVSIASLVTTIDEYYDKRELQKLNDMYYTLQDLPINHQYAYYTDTLLMADEALLKEYYERLKADCEVKVSARIKHKVINDINKLLFNSQ